MSRSTSLWLLLFSAVLGCDTTLDGEDSGQGGGDDDQEDCADPESWWPDADGDGYGAAGSDAVSACIAPDGHAGQDGDCDDANPDANPGVDEIWYDGVDGDCAGDDDYDADRDGFAERAYAGDYNGSLPATDCDDADDAVNPDATETWYDGVDQDCGDDDDYDQDADGFADAAYADDYTGSLPVTDCDDGDVAVNPDATENWYDGVDQDCGDDDDYDQDADGYADAAYASEYTGSLPVTDCDDGDGSVNTEAADSVGNSVDDNCDGVDGVDADGDGQASTDSGGDDCADDDAAVFLGASDDVGDGIDTSCDGVDGIDSDGDGVLAEASGGADCDDTDASVAPGQPDSAGDGVDQDCDGVDGVDADGDGFAGEASGGADCADDDVETNPGAEDAVGDQLDSNCDGVDGVDADADGFASVASGGDDCADDDAAIHPEASDTVGNDIDENCDAADGVDSDGDGVASEASGGEDCDDSSELAYPGADEVCGNQADDNCDGTADEECEQGCIDVDSVALFIEGEQAKDNTDNPRVEGDAFGRAIVAGDFNGDGQDDLAVSGSYRLQGQLTRRSYVKIWNGPIDQSVLDGTPTAELVDVSDQSSDFGEVLSVGDVNGDGNADLAVSFSTQPENTTNNGSVLVYFGPISGTLSPGQADLQFVGPPNAKIGSDVEIGADLNGDGVDDVVYTSHENGFMSARGVVWTHLSPHDGGRGVETSETADGYYIGATDGGDDDELELIANVGDWTGDGLDDIVVQGHNGSIPMDLYTGILYLIAGPANDYVDPSGSDIRTGFDSSPLYPTVRAMWGGWGAAEELDQLQPVGDADGDGRIDLISSSPYVYDAYDYCNWPAGGFHIFPSSLVDTYTTTAATNAYTWAWQDPCGSAPSGGWYIGNKSGPVGDWNDDSLGDVAVWFNTEDPDTGNTEERIVLFFSPHDDVSKTVLNDVEAFDVCYSRKNSGSEDFRQFGATITGGFDVTGDGRPEMLVGGAGYNYSVADGWAGGLWIVNAP